MIHFSPKFIQVNRNPLVIKYPSVAFDTEYLHRGVENKYRNKIERQDHSILFTANYRAKNKMLIYIPGK
jgi:hypothetical protein